MWTCSYTPRGVASFSHTDAKRIRTKKNITSSTHREKTKNTKAYSIISISCFAGHVKMLLHASRGGEHFTHKREKNENEKEHDKFNTTLYRTLQISRRWTIYITLQSHLRATLACQWQMEGSHVNASNARMKMRATLACNIRMNAIDKRRKAIRQVRAAGVLLHASRGGETSDMWHGAEKGSTCDL